MNIAKILLALGCFYLVSCKNETKVDTKWADFFSKVQLHYCESDRLSRRSDSLWNDVAMQMDHLLPDKMDTAVRRRIIEIKNTGIIRTFKIFHTFSDTIKHELNLVDTFDAKLVKMMHANDQVIDSLQREKLRYLSEITDDASRVSFNKKFDEITENPCKK